MELNISFDPEFTAMLTDLRERYPAELFEIDGLGSQLDINQAAKAFFNNPTGPTADQSIDPNANVVGKDVITYNYEVAKPLMKLNSYYNLWKEIKAEHGIDSANDSIYHQVMGNIYIDVWDIGRPYCFNYSAYDIALQGLQMSNRLKVAPPKSLFTFLRQMEQFVVYAANSTLGAVGLADMLIVAAGFVCNMLHTRTDNHGAVLDTKSYIIQQFESFIYTLNWEFRGNQSPFTNISVYDAAFLEQLSGRNFQYKKLEQLTLNTSLQFTVGYLHKLIRTSTL